MVLRANRKIVVAGLLLAGLWLGGCDALRARRGPTAEAFANRAEMYQRAGLLDSALVAFELALEQNPRMVGARVGIGDIHHVRGNYQAAATQYETARQLEPRNFKANYKLGLMYHLMQRLSDAVPVYLTALTIRPTDFKANLNLATAYLQMDQPQLGLPYAEAAVRLNPQSQSARVNLGAIYAAMGQYVLAIDEYRAAMELGEVELRIALNLVDAFVRVGRFEQAVNVLQTVVRTDSSAMAYERLGYIHFKMGRFDASRETYEKALEIDPDNPAVLNGLGVNLMTRYLQGKRENPKLRDKAVDYWRRSIRIEPDQQRIVDLIARYRNL